LAIQAAPITDVRAYLAKLEALAAEQVDKYVLQHPFMQDLGQGTLPREKLQEFYRQWYPFALEINTATGALYHRFHWLTKLVPEIEDLLTQKIADEFGEPGPGGHIRTLEATARKLGVTRDELVHTKLSPHARAFCDFKVRVVTEGTLAEYSMTGITEGQAPRVGRVFQQAQRYYRQDNPDDPYWDTHVEADSQQHGKYMSHQQAAYRLIELLIEHNEWKFRPGFSPEYMIIMGCKLHGLIFDDVYHGGTFESLI
jgi:pyrroloquinoline quinone (PQQ) biosynthesis protein C